MAYEKHTWQCGEVITVEKLNHMEDGIEAADCGFECTETEVTFFNGSITTAESGGVVIGSFTPSQAINTDTLTVTFNGTEYVLPKIEWDGSICYGEVSGSSPVFTNYPCFIIVDYEHFVTENAGTFTVKMEGAIVSATATECFSKAVKLFTLEHLLDGEADGSLRSNMSTPEGSGYTLGEGAVALGGSTEASGEGAFASGYYAEASGFTSFATGLRTEATGEFAFAEGRDAKATGYVSHAQGLHTIAQGLAQTAIGKYNVAQGTDSPAASTDHAFIIGNGTSDTDRSNAFAIKWNGTFVFADGTEITPAQFAALKALL